MNRENINYCKLQRIWNRPLFGPKYNTISVYQPNSVAVPLPVLYQDDLSVKYSVPYFI